MENNPITLPGILARVDLRIAFLIGTVILLPACAIPTLTANIPVSGATATAMPVVQSTPSVETTDASEQDLPGGVNNQKQAVLASIDAMEVAGPYKTHTIVTAGDRTFESIAEVIPPDRFHVIASGQEMLIIGPKSYIKQNGKWISFAADVSEIVAGVRGSLQDDIAYRISDVQQVGQETVNGTPAIVYQFKEDVGSGSDQISSLVKLWIDQARGVPIRQEIDSDVKGVKTHTVQVIQYDPNIVIDDPNQ
jgi:hypothetical protein